MLGEVMAHYGLAQPFYDAGWFETEHHRQVARTLVWAVAHRRLIAMAGLVGSGKTAFLRRVQDDLARDGKVLIHPQAPEINLPPPGGHAARDGVGDGYRVGA